MRVVRGRRSRFGCAVLAIVCALVASIGTAADHRLDYTLTKILFSLDPDVAPAGANRWDYKPSPAHPRPVIPVHGWAGT